MEMKKTIASLGIALSLAGGGLAGEYSLNKDVRIGKRYMAERTYQVEKPVYLALLNTKQDNLFFWTENGKKWLDTVDREIKTCLKKKNKARTDGVKRSGDDLLREINRQITLNCLK